MKRKILFSLLGLCSLFLLVGCNDKTEEKEETTKNEIKTTMTCSKDFYLFHSRQRLENTVYVDSDNKLVKYVAKEIYFEFDSEEEKNRTCEGLTDEANADTKKDYLAATAECSDSVSSIYTYDVSKLPSKSYIPKEEIKDNLDDNYKLDLDNYKTTLTNKQYTCIEE